MSFCSNNVSVLAAVQDSAKKEEGRSALAHCVPVMIMLKLKLVRFPAPAEAVSISVAETEVLAFKT